MYSGDGLPGVADVVATVTGVLTARVVVRFRYNGGVSMTSAAASCGPLAGGPAEWSAVTAVQSGAWSATFLASGLQPNTTYVCWANATNGAGTSANVWSGNFTTYIGGYSMETSKLATGTFTGRDQAGGVLYRNTSGSQIFALLGGLGGTALSDIQLLDVESNKWRTATVTLPSAAAFPACTWDEADTIYCASELTSIAFVGALMVSS
eukprot:tig00000158_g10208.t1